MDKIFATMAWIIVLVIAIKYASNVNSLFSTSTTVVGNQIKALQGNPNGTTV